MRYLHILLMALALIWPTAHALAGDTKPNFLVILADDIGWDAFGCTGSDYARTPNIDKLAKESVFMDRLYCSVSQCAPLRAEFYTGLLPHNNGVLANSGKVKRDNVLNVADHLKPLGYRVGLTGKSHFRLGKEKLEHINGFNGKCNSSVQPYDLSGVRDYIRSAKEDDASFCVFIGSIHAHHPWDLGDASNFPEDKITITPGYIDTPMTRKALAKHAAEVEEFDRQVGDAHAMMKEMDLEKDTILIVLSEQGIAMPRGKWSPYDHGSRALCVVSWPGHFAPQKTSAIAMYCDFVPTFVDLAGGTPSDTLDGQSMKPLWTGKSAKHRDSAFISNVHPFKQTAIVKQQYKLIWTANPETDHIFRNFFSEGKFFSKPWAEWVEQSKTDPAANKKLQHVLHPKTYELYDIKKDPYELTNLALNPEHEPVKKQLLAELKELMREADKALDAPSR